MNILLLLVTVAVVAAQTLKLLWRDDLNCDEERNTCVSRWPDGPWQGLDVSLSDGDVHRYIEPMLPSGYYGSVIVANPTDGYFSPKSKSANNSSFIMNMQDSWVGPGYAKPFSGTMYNVSLESPNVSINLMATDTLDMILPNSTRYSPRFNILGLAPLPEGPDWKDEWPRGMERPPSILEQSKERDLIGSKTFGLHIGSASLRQPGSLILGGYEQNRALGPVGVFNFNHSDGDTQAFLIDLTLGVETGGSPFEKDVKLGSIWKGPAGDEEAEGENQLYGGVRNSMVVSITTLDAYIRLPGDNCESVAKHLPVTWRKDLELYTWNTNDPSFQRIVGSPAYLGFVLSDSSARNLTIKIPFKLLNLTLDAPIVDTPTQYFPCLSGQAVRGQLGRAFLQGAFMGMNYEKHLMYLAQAPGPDMEQSVVKEHWVEDTSITTNPAESFEKTWRSTWNVIEDGDDKSSLGSQTEKGGTEGSSPSGGLSTGAIVGLIVGGLSIIAILSVVFLFWRRRQHQSRMATVKEFAEEKTLTDIGGSECPQELSSTWRPHEAPGNELYHEMDGAGYTKT